ncbi:MAG: gene transfer agent family protein [Alphaproteobacteria bacterium]|nr:gene transfer agent family protein [Alphaproteobacteria bacterium]
MTVKNHSVPLKLESRVYAVAPAFALVREIEYELGGIAGLRARFSNDGWTVSDLVALSQMMLQAAGKTVDYAALGDLILKEGVAHYLSAAQVFLDMVLHGE